MILKRAAKLLALSAALVLACLALAHLWSGVQSHLARIHVATMVAGLALGVCAVFGAMLAWRALLADLGSPLPVRVTGRIVFLSQLGKYLPGSLWPYLAQVEMSRDQEVPRSRSAAVSVIAMAVNLVTSLLIAAITMPWASPAATRRFWPVFLAVPVLLLCVYPPVLNRLLRMLLRLARRQQLDQQISLGGVGRAMGWGGLGALATGAQVWLLSADLAHVGLRDLPAVTGAYAFAWAVGFLVVIAPAGLGVREAALVAALSPLMSASAGLAIALVSRMLMTAADLLTAGGALLVRKRRHWVEAGERSAAPVATGSGPPHSTPPQSPGP